MNVKCCACLLSLIAGVALADEVKPVLSDVQVLRVKQGPVIDGKLNDACWAQAKWAGGAFQPLRCILDRRVDYQTKFAIAADEDHVYVAIRALDDNMEAVRTHEKPDMFGGDYVEALMSPSGVPFDFYHFAICPTYGMNLPLFYSEAGLTQPDPYAPEWKYAVSLESDCWTVEIAVPLSAFYMTRNGEWRDTWLFNISRVRSFGGRVEMTTWSPLEYKFPEVKNFNRVKGFPMRKDIDDVGMTGASATITGKRDGKITGELTLRVSVAVPGAYEFSSPFCTTAKLDLKSGSTEVKVPCAFDGPARYDIPMQLKRLADGRVYRRSHSVPVSYQALMWRLEKPQYRANFYPGQDASVVCGRCTSAFHLPVEVTFEGAKVGKQTVTATGDGAFKFDSSKLRPGDEAKLTFRCGDDVQTMRVRNLRPPKHRATWIEDGHLVLDGKPIFRRNMYGYGYRCSKPYMARIAADGYLDMTMLMEPEDLQFSRLVRGSKQTEGNRDVKPSQKVLDAIDAKIESLKDKDFAYYYIMDEPECGGVSPVYMRHIYEHICDRDPYHVTFMCSQAVSRFIDAVDCMEPHPYLTPRYNEKGEREFPRPMYTMGAAADTFAELGRKDKVIGVTPAAFAFRDLSWRYDYPTFDEYLANTWAMILGGAKSVYPFILDCAGHRASLYEGTRYLFSSIKALEDILLLGERTRLVKNKRHEAAIWKKGDERMFAVLNYENAAQTVELTGVEGDYREFRGERTWQVAAGGKLKVELRPFELVIGTTAKRDEKLPKRAAVERRIASLEWARTHRDNQLFGRELDLRFKVGTREGPFPFSLSDGILDNEAEMIRNGKTPNCSVIFRKGPITFRQLHLYGQGSLATFAVEVRQGDAWRELDAAAVEGRAYDTLVTFPETVTAEEIRVTFPGNVTLFEIEIPQVK